MKLKKHYYKYNKFIKILVAIVLFIIIVSIIVIAGKSRIKEHSEGETAAEYEDDEMIPEENEEAYDLTPRTLDPAVIPYYGELRAISCWGDSMMFGVGAGEAYVFGEEDVFDISGWTTPDTIEYLTGIKVYNLGVSG